MKTYAVAVLIVVGAVLMLMFPMHGAGADKSPDTCATMGKSSEVCSFTHEGERCILYRDSDGAGLSCTPIDPDIVD